MSTALAEAIVAAAKREGVVTVVVSPAPNTGPPSGGGVDPNQYNELNAAYERVKAAHGAVTAERDGFSLQLREMEAKARHYESLAAAQGGQPGAAPGAVPAQPAAIVAYEGLPIDVLQLDEKMLKSLSKTRGWDTLGKLRAALLEGKLKTEAKLTKDDIIGVAEKLLGKVPPSGVPAPTGAAAPTSNTGGAADVPIGQKDRSWMERLQAARRKEQKKRGIEAKMDQLRRGAFVGADGKPLAPQDAAKVLDTESKVLEVTNAQMTALLWSCGFEFDPAKGFGGVDDALTKAGLVALVETAPTTAEQAQQPAAPIPVPAAPQPPMMQQPMPPQAQPQQPAPSYPQQPQYAPPAPQPQPPPPPAFQQPPQGYPQQPQYAPQPGYAPPYPGQGAPPQGMAPGYGPPQGYAPQPGYPQQPPQGYAPQQPQYAPPPPPSGPGQVPTMTPGFPG